MSYFDPRTQTWNIANGQQTSTAIDKQSEDLVGFRTPGTLTSTAFTFTVSQDDATYVALTWEGTAVSITVAASQGCSLDPSKFAGWRYIKIVAGTAEGGARVIYPVFRRYG